MGIINRFASETYVDTELQKLIDTGILNKNSVEPEEDDIPKVFIKGIIPTTKDDVQAELTYISKTLTFHSYIDIKCQGTSSMKYPKKNFTIKLFSDYDHTTKQKIDFKNWGKQNKFCLKANWIDISHSRNVVSARIWSDIVKERINQQRTLPDLLQTSPNYGAIDGFPIKVYANGVYQGRYTWNIPKDKWMFNMDDELDTHCVLCSENFDSGCFRSLPLIDGSDWSDEIHDVCPESIKTNWSNVISFVLNSSDEEFKNNLNNHIDVASLVDYHIFGLTMCGLDSYGKNQIYVTYDGLKWTASMYDMDSTWGLYWNGETMVPYDYDRANFEDLTNNRPGNLLYERLEQNFYNEIIDRWNVLKQTSLSLPNIINKFERFIDITPQELVKEDYASSTANGAYTSIPSISKNNIQQIRSFAVSRYSYINEYINNLSPESRIPCTNISLSTYNLVFTSSGSQTIIATTTPENTTDRIVWTSSDSTIATVIGGVVTARNNGNVEINATCGDCSATCNVTISGVEENDETILYSLPIPTVFDGTNYIDTGVSPLATDIPFTVYIDWLDTNGSEFVGSKYVIAHCMTETNPYPGLILQYVPNGIAAEFRQNTNMSYNSQEALIANADLFRVKIVYRKASDGTITIARCYNENGQIFTNSKQVEYVSVPEELRLGCYRSNVGNPGRYAIGTMNDCKIYNYALDDDSINELLLTN
jgi:hypothetical protein